MFVLHVLNAVGYNSQEAFDLLTTEWAELSLLHIVWQNFSFDVEI